MSASSSGGKYFRWYAICLLLVCGLLFGIAFLRSGVTTSNFVIFSNDGPLGGQNQAAITMPSAFKGVWYDQNFIGAYGGSFSPTVTNAVRWLLGPINFARFYVPFVSLFLGFCVWIAL